MDALGQMMNKQEEGSNAPQSRGKQRSDSKGPNNGLFARNADASYRSNNEYGTAQG